MSQDKKDAAPAPKPHNLPEARIAKGFRDIEAAELATQSAMISKIKAVYERYGFDMLETPALEYTDALGKFLPDQDRPNAGVFSFQDEDEQWMSLRYDLTAPLARYVAQNFDKLPKPFRRYAFGNVYRNEKPGPGRFRQFLQFDADTVGSDNIAADAEMCMLAADTLEALGIKRGNYVIKVNSRLLIDGIMEALDLGGDANASRRLTVLRALDKWDRLGRAGVELLLTKGRKDESGDFTSGAGLIPFSAGLLLDLLEMRSTIATGDPAKKIQTNPIVYVKNRLDQVENRLLVDAFSTLFDRGRLKPAPSLSVAGQQLGELAKLIDAAGYGDGRIVIDPSVIRGLEYYTGPVFEAELTFEVKGDDGQLVRFGSVGGGGRYDDLVARFTGQKVPATGFSIGVSRLQAALALINAKPAQPLGPVVVLVMDKAEIASYQKMVQTLRQAGIRAEMYLGSSGMKAQVKYADKRNSPCVIIQGSDERAKGEVTIKDLIEGAKAAAAIKDNKEWKAARPAQISVPESALIDEVRKIIELHAT
jgi:histidyl-tRNA synthetase